MSSVSDMVTRTINAQQAFVANLVEAFGLTEQEANHVFTVFRRHKCIKLVVSMGRWDLKHGGLWERSVIDEALTM